MSHPTASLLYISRTVWARITKFYRHIQADLPYIDTEYGVTSYFRSEATAQKPSKMPPQAALGGISRERFKRGSPHLAGLSGTTGPTDMPDMTSLITYGRLKMQLNTIQNDA